MTQNYLIFKILMEVNLSNKQDIFDISIILNKNQFKTYQISASLLLQSTSNKNTNNIEPS